MNNIMSRHRRHAFRVPIKQQGLVLLMVLLIFSIVSLMASSMLQRQSVDLERSGTHLLLQQTRAYAFAAEEAVKTGLYLDGQLNNNLDHLTEEWNNQRVFPLEPGTVAITIKDAQGKFNLNSLSPEFPSNDIQRKRFERLLNRLGLETRIAKNWSDWLNKESQVENDYLIAEIPYRAAYQPCVHSSELLLINDLDSDAYRKLEPYVACLPPLTPLNINTADSNILASLDQEMSDAMVSAIVNGRGQEGFASVADFFALDELKPLTEAGGGEDAATKVLLKEADFAVATEYFEIFARIDLEGRMATTELLLNRNKNDGAFNTIYRDYSRREARAEPQAGDVQGIQN